MPSRNTNRLPAVAALTFLDGGIGQWEGQMKHFRQFAVASLLCACGGAIRLSAHHAFAAEFDETRPFTLKGVITKVEWINPHVYVHLDVQDGDGRTTSWALETGPPLMLRRGGLTRDQLGLGESVSIDVFAAKDGSRNLAWFRKITFRDGHSVEVWLSDPKNGR
jgi:hypothetical protein